MGIRVSPLAICHCEHGQVAGKGHVKVKAGIKLQPLGGPSQGASFVLGQQ